MSETSKPNQVSLRRAVWWGDVLLIGLCAALILAAFITEPSYSDVKLFGYSIPPLCASRNLFGVECLGCGMSRSWSFLAHGNLEAAFDVNGLGPFVFALAASQVPYRMYKVMRDLQRYSKLRSE